MYNFNTRVCFKKKIFHSPRFELVSQIFFAHQIVLLRGQLNRDQTSIFLSVYKIHYLSKGLNSLNVYKIFFCHQEELNSSRQLFECLVCEFTGNHPKTLKSHVNTRHNDNLLYKCRFCPFSCASVYSIQTHVFATHPTQIVRCSQCAFAALFESRVDRHMLKMHGVHLNSIKNLVLQFKRFFESKNLFCKNSFAVNQPFI